MENHDALITEIMEQEKLLRFTEFTSDTALQIGLKLIERARKEGKAIAIDITRNGQQLFHFAGDGTSIDNEQWIAGKNKMVHRFNRSSYYCSVRQKQSGKTTEQTFRVSSADYIACGGSFPITIKNVGVVGTIAVSGMTEELDHGYIVDAIKAQLGA